MAAELQEHEHGDLRWKVIVTNNPHSTQERIALIEADALAGLIERLDKAERAVAHYENTISWETTCHGCAASADAAVKETARAEKAERRLAADERTLDRVIALAWNMREWCSPDGVAVDYADRLAEALIGAEEPMKRGEAFFVLEAIGKTRHA